jgi:hypothetical protein
MVLAGASAVAIRRELQWHSEHAEGLHALVLVRAAAGSAAWTAAIITWCY